MSGLVTIAGGVVAVYIILALIVSQVVEWITTILNVRGRLLRRAILEMFSVNKSNAGPAKLLVDAIYSHPLVGNLGMKRLPSYIAPRTFTISLVGALRTITPIGQKKPAPGPGLDADADTLLKDLRDRLDTVLPADDTLRNSIGLLIEQTENKYESVLKAFDSWYDAQMDRVTGTFKRYAASVQIGLSFIVVYLFHVDTIALINNLSKTDAAQRAVSAAQTAQQSPDLVKAVSVLAKSGLIAEHALNGLSVWMPISFQEGCGVLVTWLAVLLGAPFWFDVLKRIVPVRLTGTKPDAEASRKGDTQAEVPTTPAAA